MATVIWGQSGTAGMQPVEGAQRHFIIRARIDGYTGGVPAIYNDTNKVFIIKAGWMLSKVTAILRRAPTTASITLAVGDSGSTTRFLTSTVTGTGYAKTGTVGKMVQSTTSCNYTAANYLNAYFYTGSKNFDGILDIFAEVIDTTVYESPAAYTN